MKHFKFKEARSPGILLFFFFAFQYAHGQPAIQWQKCLGGTGGDYGTSVWQTTDGGFILGGRSASNDGDVSGHHGGTRNDFWIVKSDASGNIVWQQSLGGDSTDDCRFIQQTSDGGYIAAGRSISQNGQVTGNHGNYDFWLVKLDAGGTIAWNKCFGGPLSDEAQIVKQCADGGYLVGGQSKSDICPDKSANNWDTTHATNDFWIVKTDASGTIQWDKTYGGIHEDALFSLLQTSDGGFLLGGYSYSGISGNKTVDNRGAVGNTSDIWIIKTDNSGNKIWENRYGGTGSDFLRTLQTTTDGGFALAGDSYSDVGFDKSEPNWGASNTGDFWFVKTDGAGSKLWDRRYGCSDVDYCYGMITCFDGGYMLVGRSDTMNDGNVTGNHGGPDFWAVKTDDNGNVKWQKSLGGTSAEYANSVFQTSDSGYAVVGFTQSNNSDVSGNHGGADYWLVKLFPDLRIVSATATSGNRLDVRFSNPLDQSTAETEANYSVDNAVGNPVVAQLDPSDHALVHLEFTMLFTSGSMNTITINNIQDSTDNILPANSVATFTYTAINPFSLAAETNYFFSGVDNHSICDRTANYGFSVRSITNYSQVSFQWSISPPVPFSVSDDSTHILVHFNNVSWNADYVISVSIDSSGFDTTLADTVHLSPGASPDTVLILLHPISNTLVCADNTADYYQWGYDDAGTWTPHSIPNATFQDYLAGSSFDPANRYYWVTVYYDSCFNKLYYNPPYSRAIDPDESSSQLSLYPSPADDILHIPVDSPGAVELISSVGSRCVHKVVQTSASTITLDISDLSDGIYFVQLRGEKECRVGRFVKNSAGK